MMYKSNSASRISSIGKDNLPSNPLAIRAQKLDNRSNIFDIRQSSLHRTILMKCHCFWRFLWVKESCSTGQYQFT